MVRILVLQGGKWIRIRVSQGERLVHPTVVLAHEEEVRAEIRLNSEKDNCTDRGIIAKKASSPGRLDRIVG